MMGVAGRVILPQWPPEAPGPGVWVRRPAPHHKPALCLKAVGPGEVEKGRPAGWGFWPVGSLSTWSHSPGVPPGPPPAWAKPPECPIMHIHFPLCWAFCQRAWECEGLLPQASLSPARAVTRGPLHRPAHGAGSLPFNNGNDSLAPSPAQALLRWALHFHYHS